MPNPPSERAPRDGGRTDKGRANRVALDVPVLIWEGRSSSAGVAKNIGRGGVFVATVRPLAVGERVTVTVQMRGDAAPVEALAEVRWCRPFVDLDDRPAGVGLRFIDTPLRAAILASELQLTHRPGAS
jgi:uncharacterized protein (TIGR02266 family)